MRRSNSASHIPMRVSTDKGARAARPRSITRPTVLPLIRVQPPVTDRPPSIKRSNSGQSLLIRRKTATPVASTSKRSFLRPSSIFATPSSSRCGRSPIRSTVKKERPVTDKKWVSEQFAKVRHYVANNPFTFDENVANALRPPSIKMFVTVISALFTEIDPRINVNMANYKESVVAELKGLKYPGIVSISTLKTINTMHTWPQVVNMFSWLIDLIEIVKGVDQPSTKSAVQSDSQFEMEKTLDDFFHDRHKLFNEDDPQPTSEIDQILIDKFKTILNVNSEETARYENKLRTLQNLTADKQVELEGELAQNEAISNDSNAKTIEMGKFYEESPLDESAMSSELAEMEENIQKSVDKINKIKEEIEKLKATIANQTYTASDRETILKSIESLTYTKSFNQNRLDKFQELRHKFDLNLAELQQNVEIHVQRLNTQLIELCLTHPEFNRLTLRENRFHDAAFKDELIRAQKIKQEIDEIISKKLADIQKRIKTVEKETNESLEKMPALKKELDHLKHVQNDLLKKIEDTKQQTKMIENEIIAKEQEFKERMLRLKKDEPDCKSADAKLAELDAKSLKMMQNLDELQANGINFFVQIYNEIVGAVGQMDVMLMNIQDALENNAKIVVEQQDEILQELQKLMEISELK